MGVIDAGEEGQEHWSMEGNHAPTLCIKVGCCCFVVLLLVLLLIALFFLADIWQHRLPYLEAPGQACFLRTVVGSK